MQEISNSTRDWLALTLVPGLGPKLTAALLQKFGSASAILSAQVSELAEVNMIGRKTAEKLGAGLAHASELVERELAVMRQHQVQVTCQHDDDFPQSLIPLPDAPSLLYRKGTWLPADNHAIAIVGSRRCTPYGVKHTSRIAAELVQAGYTIVSGLALGIDGAAHQGAIEAGGRTVAVLAGGLASIYPPEHNGLAEVVANQGCLMSEVPMGMRIDRGMFHARNRIISGLAIATVVIEANDASGALITARHTLDQGREVFALPANVDNPASAGSLQLIRDGARLIRSARDILDDLRPLGEPVPTRPAPLPDTSPKRPTLKVQGQVPVQSAKVTVPHHINEDELVVWNLLEKPTHADQLIQQLGRPTADVMRLMMQMELKRIIRRQPGNIYCRVVEP